MTTSNIAFLNNDAEGLIIIASPKQPQFTLLPAVIHSQMRYRLKNISNADAAFSTHLFFPNNCNAINPPRPHSRPIKKREAIAATICGRCTWSVIVYSKACMGKSLVYAEYRNKPPVSIDIIIQNIRKNMFIKRKPNRCCQN